MKQNVNNYTKIYTVIFFGLSIVLIMLVLTSINSIEQYLINNVGEHAFYLVKVMPWGGFGAIMHASFLSAKDKHANYKKEKSHEKDKKLEEPNYPDLYDVFMYFIYFISGLILAILSAYFMEVSIDYVSNSGGMAIKDKFGLFAIFAFYAGYSQFDLINKVSKKAKETSNNS
jgi:hypothetical protein